MLKERVWLQCGVVRAGSDVVDRNDRRVEWRRMAL